MLENKKSRLLTLLGLKTLAVMILTTYNVLTETLTTICYRPSTNGRS